MSTIRECFISKQNNPDMVISEQNTGIMTTGFSQRLKWTVVVRITCSFVKANVLLNAGNVQVIGMSSSIIKYKAGQK